MKTIAISGYFIWIHIGHTEYFREAAKYGRVVCIVNNDEQQKLKYGRIIVPLDERMEVLRGNKYISEVIPSIDRDRTVCKSLEKLKPNYFGKGGDRSYSNIPETTICEELGIQMIFGLGNKIQSSSWLISKLKEK